MNKNNKVSKERMDEIKAWMETHPNEYAQFAENMNQQGIGEILKLGEAALSSSPKFTKEVEKMMTNDSFDAISLLESLSMSDFAADYFSEKSDDRMAMAAWIKYGESPELILDELDNTVVQQGKQKYRTMLSNLRRLLFGKFFYRKDQPNREFYYQRHQAPSSSPFQALLASHNEDLIKRIGEWAIGGSYSGMSMAHLYIALVEVGEISAKLPLTKFLNAMKESYPKHPTIGVRQLQKSVCYLQSLSPNKKQYGKDELEHRYAIDLIKSEVILVTPNR